MYEVFSEGDYALIHLDRRRRYLVKVGRGKQLHTHRGYLKLEELLGKPKGIPLDSSRGVRFYAFKPTLWDYIENYRRPTQIMYPKDVGLILAYTGIGPGSRVVEAGVGSGGLTSFLAYHVKPYGRVYGYDVNLKFLEIARGNLEVSGLAEYVELKHGNVYEAISERNVDAVVLDLGSPWMAVGEAYKALKPGGFFVSFSPTVNQMEKTVEALKGHQGYVVLEALECIVRRYKVKQGETRPETVMIGHTGYLVFARKIVKPDEASG